MITPFYLYEWQRLFVNLCSAPSSFQQIVAKLINGIPRMTNLLDDIIFCGTTQAEHDERLNRLLQNLAKRDIVINTERSWFSVDAVDFVGHQVWPRGVSPFQWQVEAIFKLDTPTSLKEIRRLFGSASVYRKFVPQFSDIVEALNDLLRGDTDFSWRDQYSRPSNNSRRRLLPLHSCHTSTFSYELKSLPTSPK